MSGRFVSESQIEESKRKRQEEWDQTRKEDDPLEPPEEVYDPRTLYERLQEQKTKKQEEFEESRKLKNMIRGLDNDEIEFLNEIDNTRAEQESLKYKEELMAIEEFKRQTSQLNAGDADRKLLEFKRELFQIHKNKEAESDKNNKTEKKKSQAAMILGAIKRKTTTSSPSPVKKVKPEDGGEDKKEGLPKFDPSIPTQYCIGSLPGLGFYDDDSDSDRESDESQDDLEHIQVIGAPSSCGKDKSSSSNHNH